MVFKISNETQQIDNWEILGGQPVYLANQHMSGLPTCTLATVLTFEQQEEDIPEQKQY